MNNIELRLIDKRLEQILKKWGKCLRKFPVLHINLNITEGNYKKLFTEDIMIFQVEKWVQALAAKSEQERLYAFVLRQYYYYVDSHYHGEKQQYLQKMADLNNTSLATFKHRYKFAKTWLSGCLTVHETMKTNDTNLFIEEKNHIDKMPFFSSSTAVRVKNL